MMLRLTTYNTKYIIYYLILYMHHSHALQSKLFNYATYTLYILYIAVTFGLFASAPEYLTKLNTYLKLYISLFLIWRFNPWTHSRFSGYDKRIAYEAGVYLLLSVVLTDVALVYIDEIKWFFTNVYHSSFIYKSQLV